MKVNDISMVRYQQIHYWLKKNFGKAKRCEDPRCNRKSKKFAWALKRGCEYSFERRNFKELCYSCHATMDSDESKSSKMRIIRKGKLALTKMKGDCKTCQLSLSVPRPASQVYCSKCSLEKDRGHKTKWRNENLVKSRQASRNWQRRNLEKCRVHQKKYRDSLKLKNPLSDTISLLQDTIKNLKE